MYIFTDKKGKIIEQGDFNGLAEPGKSAKHHAEMMEKKLGEPIFAWILLGGQDQKNLQIKFA